MTEFEKYLASVHAAPKPDSQLQRSIAAARELQAAYEVGQIPLGVDAREWYWSALGVFALALKVLASRGTAVEVQTQTRLRALSKGRHLPLPSDASSSARNSVLETLAAFAAASFATDVDFKEPDVTCSHDGRRWGIAAKVAYGKPETVADRVDEGREQIRRQAELSRIDRGVVLLDLTNQIPHELLLQQHPTDSGLWTSFVERGDLQKVQSQLFDHLIRQVLDRISPASPDEPTVAVVVTSCAVARLNASPIITRLSTFDDFTGAAAKNHGDANSDANLIFVNRLMDGLRLAT